MSCTGIVLAAGSSLRMGQPKQLLSVHGRPLLEHVVAAACSAQLDDVVVILGADHRIVGILSERDIVRALAEHGPTALNERVSQVMTRDVKTCTEDDTIEDLMGRMTSGKFRHMPVVKQEKLIGIVSIGDVVKNRVEEIEHEAKALRDYIRQ